MRGSPPARTTPLSPGLPRRRAPASLPSAALDSARAAAWHGHRPSAGYEPGRKLVEIGFPDDNRAGLLQPGYRLRVPLGHIGERGAGGPCRQVGDIDVVVDGNGNAIQCQRHVACESARAFAMIASCSRREIKIAGSAASVMDLSKSMAGDESDHCLCHSRSIRGRGPIIDSQPRTTSSLDCPAGARLRNRDIQASLITSTRNSFVHPEHWATPLGCLCC